MRACRQDESSMLGVSHHLHKVTESCVLILAQIVGSITQVNLSKKVIVIENALGVFSEELLSLGDLRLDDDGFITLF